MWTAKKIKYVHISWIYWQKCLHLLVHVEILPLCAVVYGDSSRWHKNSKTLKWLLNIENKEPQSGYVTNFWRKWVMGSEGFHSFRWHFPGNMKFVWFFSFVWFRFRNRPKRITIDKNYHLSTHRRLLMNALMRFLFFSYRSSCYMLLSNRAHKPEQIPILQTIFHLVLLSLRLPLFYHLLENDFFPKVNRWII